MQKEQILNQLKDLASTTGKQIVDDMKEYINDGKHEEMEKLAVRALKLKAAALAEDDADKRRELADDLEFTLARIKTKIETEKIAITKSIVGTLMTGLKTALSGFASAGQALVSSIVQGAVKGVTGSLGDAISDKIGDAFAHD